MENTNIHTKQKVGILELESHMKNVLSTTQECQVKNKILQSTDNSKNLNIQHLENLKKSLMLDLDLTLKEKVLKPFWKEQLKEKYSTLWLPTKIDLQESVSISSNGLWNMQEGQSKSLITHLNLKNSTMKTSLALSQSFATHTTEKGQIVTKKIRIYPENVEKWKSLCDLSRYSYNAMISYKKDYKLYVEKSTVYRKIITDNAKKWDNYVNHVIQEACRDADITTKSIIRNRKNGIKSDFKFRSRKNKKQLFNIQKLPKSGIYPKYLGKNTIITENIPEYAFGKAATVIHEYGEWYLCCQDLVYVDKQDINEKSKIIALDPGSRKFLVGYNHENIITIGDNYQKNRILPLLLKVDKLYSERSKLPKMEIDSPQWVLDRHRYLEKKMDNIRIRVNNLKDNLHRISANYLVKNYDVILLPTFKTSDMIVDLNNKATRNLLSLNHFKFKTYLKWICKKYGKLLIDVDESYTSKTNPFNGELMDIGSNNNFTYKDKKYDRDVNGARNIYIKNLIR